jgi:hypothetical protein
VGSLGKESGLAGCGIHIVRVPSKVGA